MATFVVAHGAWSAGWAWKKMHPRLAARGHRLITPTLTGLGERSHLAHEGIDLDTHITDILNVLHYDDLRDVVLIGHSYGGMVATGVADRGADRVSKLVYIDAFAPRDGESAFDVMPAATRAQRADAVASGPDSWRIPPGPMPPDTPPEDIAWSTPKRVPHPLKCFAQKIKLSAEPKMPRFYIYAGRKPPDDRFRRFYERAQNEKWAGAFEIDASHNPHITAPDALTDLLDQIARA
ncbi:MAG: alpha/beta hydrolase [Pseudolabrys sp.]|nr:alpha/beta hydrolase [Pseudolabrys sp.]MBV9955436.1 alpha/beta hydrolase [Pseudolabrys sp.]